MELLFFHCPLLFLLISFLIIKLLIKPKWHPSRNLPPGPRKLPIIGSLHHLLLSPHKLSHHLLWALSKAHGPIMHLQLGQIPTVVVTSGDVTKEFFKNHDIIIASRPDHILATKVILYGPVDMLFSPFSEYYRKMRKMFVTELMSTKRVNSYSSIREAETMDLIRSVGRHAADSDHVNLSEMLHMYMSNLIARVAFGKRRDDAMEFLDAFGESLLLGSGFSAVDLFPSCARVLGWVTGMTRKIDECHKRVDRILQGIIDERREKAEKEGEEGGEENILDVLCRIQEEGGYDLELNHSSMKAILFDIFAGGSGTSSSVMAWTMSELIINPRVMNKTQDEVRRIGNGKPKITESDIQQLSYLRLVIKEALRLHPPAPLLVPRLTTDKFQVKGYDIPKRTQVVFNEYAIARDPDVWEEAEVFKPERFEDSLIDFKGTNYDFIPFGAGRRLCPGMVFGLVSMEIALANLLYCFDWSLPKGIANLDMGETTGLGARRKYDLCLCATPYIPLPFES